VSVGPDYHWTQCIATLEGHDWGVDTISMSIDGSRVVSGSSNVVIWEVATGSAVDLIHYYRTALGFGSSVASAAFSPDGRHVVTALRFGSTCCVWDTVNLKKGDLPQCPVGYVCSVTFSEDGTNILYVSIVETKVDDERTSVEYFFSSVNLFPIGSSPPLIGPDPERLCITTRAKDTPVSFEIFAPNGNLLAIRIQKKEVRIWDTRTRSPMTPLLTLYHEMNNVAFSACGTRMVSCSDSQICVWDNCDILRLP